MIASKKIFHINSSNRLHGTSSDFDIKIDLPKNNEFNRVCVMDISIPKSYYMVSQGSNTFEIENNVISVPPGNYSRKSFQTTLNLLLPEGYTVSYNNTNLEPDIGKFLFSGISETNLSFPSTSRLYELMGFGRESINRFIEGQLISTNVCNLQQESTLFLHSNLGSNDDNDILLEVFSMANPAFSTISLQVSDIEAHSRVLTTRNNNNYRFSLQDENGYPIDLNGLNYVFTLLVYQQEPVYRMIRGLIKYNLLLNEQ